MENDKMQKSNEMFYNSVNKLNEALKAEEETIQEYNLDIPIKKNGNIQFEMLNNEGEYGILFTYFGKVSLNARSENCYVTDWSIDDIYLRKFYKFQNEESTSQYFNILKGTENLLDTYLFGTNTLAEDLVLEMELALQEQAVTRKLIN